MFVYPIHCEHVTEWSFLYVLTASQVRGLGTYKLLLPPCARVVRLVSSPDVVWDVEKGERLEELYADGELSLLFMCW